jgi:hypothetical protein
MERLLDELIGDVRAVVVAGIDMVDARRNASRRTAIATSTSRGGPSVDRKLHGAVAHSVQGHRCTGQSEVSGEVSLFHHLVPPAFLCI